MAKKKTIYFSRTYRRVHTNFRYALLYMVLLVVPTLLLLVLNLGTLTKLMSRITVNILSQALPGKNFSIMESSFAPLGSTYCLAFEGSFPSPVELLINLIAVVVIISILALSSVKGRPLAIFLLFSSMIHIISCVYFVFETDFFIYTATEFSDIFMKQQVSIWILFVVLIGVITGFIGSSGLIYKILTFFAVIIYSIIFGAVRYIVFMFVLADVSILYMADMYFIVGPIFDFLYLVAIYSIYSNKMEKILDSPKGEDEWSWL